MSKLTKNISYGKEFHEKIASGVEKINLVARAAYGPGASNVICELSYGAPLISRDGVTNVEKVYLEDPVENMAARLLVQASQKSNKRVGDGTTAVVVLAAALYAQAQLLIAAGMNRMAVSRLLKSTSADVISQLDKLKVTVDAKMLRHVASISASDPAIGAMIADVIEQVGIDAGITVEDFAGAGVYNELVDGFYFRKGFTSVNLINDPSNLESRHKDTNILISEKRMSTRADIVPILEKIVSIVGKGGSFIWVGDVAEEALGVMFLNRMKGVINVVPVDVPVHGALRSLTLEDLALVTGGKVYVHGANPNDFNISMMGSASEVIINEFSTTILGGQTIKEDVDKRLDELRKQLSEADSPVTAEALKERISRLSGKVAIIRVGGATEVEQAEVKLRVQDAISAVQAALRDGIVPGGGIALALTKTEYFKQAFRQPFKDLAENSGYNTERALWKIQANSKATRHWYGYDFRKEPGSYELVNLMSEGIVDPALVVKEVVRNATSIVAELVTANLGITILDRKEKYD